MTEIKYHPLIDCDSEGGFKVPMFSTENRQTVSTRHGMWLEEIIPKYYRLCTAEDMSPAAANALTISCPYCGKPMKATNTIPDNRDAHRLGLYTCPDCN